MVKRASTTRYRAKAMRKRESEDLLSRRLMKDGLKSILESLWSCHVADGRALARWEDIRLREAWGRLARANDDASAVSPMSEADAGADSTSNHA